MSVCECAVCPCECAVCPCECAPVNETTEADDANEDIIFGSDSELDDIDEVSVSVLDGVRESCCALSDCKRDEGGRCV